jgi:Pterin 4 alpha carbinolamine dehydratase
LIAEPGESISRRVRCAKLVAVGELATAHCEVCAPGTPPLPEEDAARLSPEVPDWERDANRSLHYELSFADFGEDFGFVARVALIAEAEGHHPDSSWAGVALRSSSPPTPPPA